MRHFNMFTFVFVSVLVSGCYLFHERPDYVAPMEDSGPFVGGDAGPTEPDAGPTEPDLGSIEPDSGPIIMADAGTDAGPIVTVDAGPDVLTIIVEPHTSQCTLGACPAEFVLVMT